MAAKRSTNTSMTSPKKLSSKERSLEALRLRKTGMSFQEIAQRLGWKGESGARNAVNRLLAKTEFEAVADYRKLKILQLEGLYQEIYAKRKNKDGSMNLWAVDRLQNIIDQVARMLGLYSPTQVEIYDWRKEFEEAGLDGDALADKLFEQALEEYNRKRQSAGSTLS